MRIENNQKKLPVIFWVLIMIASIVALGLILGIFFEDDFKNYFSKQKNLISEPKNGLPNINNALTSKDQKIELNYCKVRFQQKIKSPLQTNKEFFVGWYFFGSQKVIISFNETNHNFTIYQILFNEHEIIFHQLKSIPLFCKDKYNSNCISASNIPMASLKINFIDFKPPNRGIISINTSHRTINFPFTFNNLFQFNYFPPLGSCISQESPNLWIPLITETQSSYLGTHLESKHNLIYLSELTYPQPVSVSDALSSTNNILRLGQESLIPADCNSTFNDRTIIEGNSFGKYANILLELGPEREVWLLEAQSQTLTTILRLDAKALGGIPNHLLALSQNSFFIELRNWLNTSSHWIEVLFDSKKIVVNTIPRDEKIKIIKSDIISENAIENSFANSIAKSKTPTQFQTDVLVFVDEKIFSKNLSLRVLRKSPKGEWKKLFLQELTWPSSMDPKLLYWEKINSSDFLLIDPSSETPTSTWLSCPE